MALDQLLKFLQGHSSSDPVSFTCISSRLGLQPVSLNILLDQLYEQRQINQAFVTKDGRKQRMVWPTGVVGFIDDDYYRKTAKISPTIPPPRRTEAKPKPMEETNMTHASVPTLTNVLADKTASATLQANDTLATEKPRALQVLEFIEANPGVSVAEINQQFAFLSPISYIKKHVEKKKVLAVYMTKRAANYSIAAGFTAASIYGKGIKNNGRHPDTELVEKAFTGSKKEGYEIPAFLRTEAKENEAAASPKFDSDLGFYADTAPKNISIQFSQDDFAIDAINTLFDLLPPQSAIVIGRADGELQIDIEADVFGKPVAKMVQLNEVISTLSALHIVTVEMA